MQVLKLRFSSHLVVIFGQETRFLKETGFLGGQSLCGRVSIIIRKALLCLSSSDSVWGDIWWFGCKLS
ncbi:MAG: hypothetical protein DSM106950_11135 [Stigonema ocellatum SAG 48.90 = DSM 106950]|nr:hypothetical protein [Stigonema ocellatum SAG 48.90 = DSM 106950]